MDDINLGLYPQPRLCLLGLTTNQNLMDYSDVCVFTVELLWTVFNSCCHLPPYPHPPTHPLNTLAQIGAHLQKNGLKWPKIKQVTNSNLYYIKIQ